MEHQKEFWSIRGVSEEVKRQAMVYAKGQGKNVGEWLSDIIWAYGLAKSAEDPPDSSVVSSLDAIHARLDALGASLDRLLSHGQQESSASSPDAIHAKLDALGASLDRLLSHGQQEPSISSPDAIHARQNRILNVRSHPVALSTEMEEILKTVYESKASQGVSFSWTNMVMDLNRDGRTRPGRPWTTESLRSWCRRHHPREGDEAR